MNSKGNDRDRTAGRSLRDHGHCGQSGLRRGVRRVRRGRAKTAAPAPRPTCFTARSDRTAASSSGKPGSALDGVHLVVPPGALVRGHRHLHPAGRQRHGAPRDRGALRPRVHDRARGPQARDAGDAHAAVRRERRERSGSVRRRGQGLGPRRRQHVGPAAPDRQHVGAGHRPARRAHGRRGGRQPTGAGRHRASVVQAEPEVRRLPGRPPGRRQPRARASKPTSSRVRSTTACSCEARTSSRTSSSTCSPSSTARSWPTARPTRASRELRARLVPERSRGRVERHDARDRSGRSCSTRSSASTRASTCRPPAPSRSVSGSTIRRPRSPAASTRPSRRRSTASTRRALWR